MLFKLASVLVISSLLVFAKPHIKVKYEFYDIYPTDTKTIEEAMDETTPLIDYRTPVHGVVNWYVTYDYKRVQEENKCKIEDVQTNLVVIYKVPRIATNHKVSKDTKRSFRRYFETLNSNLGRYKNIAKNCAKKIEKELSAIPNKKDCHLITKNAYTKAEAIILSYRAEHKNFALKTFNGYAETMDKEF